MTNHLARRPAASALLASAITLALTHAVGCGSSWFASEDNTATAVKPEDFVGQARPTTADTAPTPTSLVATDTHTNDTGTGSDSTTSSNPPRDSNDALAVNAMVGHINGEAVYADQVFDVNVAAQLSNYGRRFGQEDFLEQASLVIREKLKSIVQNKLILGEAERNLKERERMAIDRAVQARREEQIRFYGQGSLSLAKAKFREEKGMELDDDLSQYREALLTQSYIRSKVYPKIVVNDRDIEQWYDAHLDYYRQPSKRAFRIIRIADNDTAQRVADRLDRGESFEDIASDATVNLYNPTGSGLFSNGQALAGDNVYGVKPVNDALIQLEQGQHAGPILAGKHHYFVQLVELMPGIHRTLQEPDVQFQIRKTLEDLQFKKHADRFIADLLERGSYTPESEMGAKLLEIAYARYKR